MKHDISDIDTYIHSRHSIGHDLVKITLVGRSAYINSHYADKIILFSIDNEHGKNLKVIFFVQLVNVVAIGRKIG